jgi:hypothetical protein
MDGFALLAKVRELDGGAAVPAALTAFAVRKTGCAPSKRALPPISKPVERPS